MIKLIIFDFSGVVSVDEEDPYIEKFAKKHNISFDDLNELYTENLKKSERNEIPLSEVWNKVMEKFNIKGDYKDFVKEMMFTKTFYQETLKFVLELRKKYKTAYFSNYAEEYWDYVIKLEDLEKYFDFGIVSYQIGSRKPEPKGFKLILEHFNLKPDEAVFTDDAEKNLINAKELGINTIHFKNLEQFKEELNKLI